jgi:hypothetical protein
MVNLNYAMQAYNKHCQFNVNTWRLDGIVDCLIWLAIVNHEGSRNMVPALDYKHCHIPLEDR